MKKVVLVVILSLSILFVNAQFTNNYELNAGVVTQKTEKLYWENGVGADFTSDFLLKKQIHLKAAYVTSTLGSAMGTNAIKQNNFIVGADWHFFSKSPLQVYAGLNTGYFSVNYEEMFNELPHASMLMQFESGLTYKFKFPLSTSLSFGYNIINGDGINKPGTLFPVFYQLKMYYRIK